MSSKNFQQFSFCRQIIMSLGIIFSTSVAKGQVEAPYFTAKMDGQNDFARLQPNSFFLRGQSDLFLFPSSSYCQISSSAPSLQFINDYPHPIGGSGNLAKWFYKTNGIRIEIMSLETTGAMTVKYLPYLGDYKNMQYNSSTGQIGYDNSSRRFKTNITPLQDDWSKILQVRPVKYNRPISPEYWEFGYVAEEIDSIGLTNLVGYDSCGIPDDVRYDKMVLYLTEMIKIQDQSIKDLQTGLLGQQQLIEEQKMMLDKVLNRKKRHPGKTHRLSPS